MYNAINGVLVSLFARLHDAPLDWMMARFGAEQRRQTLAILVKSLARLSRKDEDTARSFFPLAQAMGFHFLRVLFFSPVPDTSNLPDTTLEPPIGF